MTKAQFNKYLQHVDTYFKANFDGTKVPYSTTKDYKTFAIQCKALINTKHSSVSFEDYASNKDTYQAFNKLMPSYDALATTATDENIWADV